MHVNGNGSNTLVSLVTVIALVAGLGSRGRHGSGRTA